MNDNTIPTPIFGYKSIQKRKPEGRGVALYHKNDNKLQIETINWEILSVGVNIHNTSIFSIYRTNRNLETDELEEILDCNE